MAEIDLSDFISSTNVCSGSFTPSADTSDDIVIPYVSNTSPKMAIWYATSDTVISGRYAQFFSFWINLDEFKYRAFATINKSSSLFYGGSSYHAAYQVGENSKNTDWIIDSTNKYCPIKYVSNNLYLRPAYVSLASSSSIMYFKGGVTYKYAVFF